MKEKVNITRVLEKTQSIQSERIETSRLGWVVKLDLDNDLIYVDYENNPLNVPVTADLANPELTIEDLEYSRDLIKHIQLTFMDGNPAKPIIRDVLYSAVSLRKQKQSSAINQNIHIKAKELILEGTDKVTIRCGEAQTTYLANENKIIEEAEKIDSSATLTHKLKGGTIALN